jgi:diguanylate cyclase (GGDEF)-like protein
MLYLYSIINNLKDVIPERELMHMKNTKRDAKGIAELKMTMELVKSLFGEKMDVDNDKRELIRLRHRYGDRIYCEALYLITNTLIDDDRRAKRLIDKIIRHRKTMNRLLRRDVGLQVAALDYLQNKEGMLENPTFIERRKIQKLAEHAITDDDIQIYDKSILFLDLKEEVERSKRYGSLFSVIILDIDNFKTINDTYGHMFGDAILYSLADTLKKNIRKTDSVYRYGGDEFVLLLPETGLKEAENMAVKAKYVVQDIRLHGMHTRLHLSMGVASCQNRYTTGKDMLHDADMALYRAKQSGKNRIYKHTAAGFKEAKNHVYALH